MSELILVIDEGTTSTRAMLFGADGTCLGTEQSELNQYYPQPGWVEHDAEEIWAILLACARAMVAKAGGAERIAAIGITNQRETIVFWSRRTGEALGRAIVWQDRRTAELCARLKEEGHEEALQAKTGLLLDPYFSATKIAWALENWPAVREAGEDLCVGTVESWLVFRLTGGLHVSDATNASRTALMDIHAGGWDEGLLDLFGVPAAALPEIVDCAGRYGETATCSARRSRSAAWPATSRRRRSARPASARARPRRPTAPAPSSSPIPAPRRRVSRHRLLSTIAWQLGGERRLCAGRLGVRRRQPDPMAARFARPDRHRGRERGARALGRRQRRRHARAGSGRPRRAALGARRRAAAISGLSFATGRAHIVRAALEAMAHQTHDLMTAFAGDGAAWERLKIDGGMVANDWLAQDLADMLDLAVERPAFVETTALGAAMLAGVGAGLFGSLEEAAAMRGAVGEVRADDGGGGARSAAGGWGDAVRRLLAP